MFKYCAEESLLTLHIGAWKKRNLELPSDPSLLFNLDDVQITDDARKLKQKLPHSKQFCFLNKAAIKNSEKSGEILKVNKWYLSTSTDVEEVKMVITMHSLDSPCALTEIKRLRMAQSHGLVDDPSKVVPLSVFWLVPQFFFVVSGEAFTYIGQLDFLERVTGDSEPWLADNLNKGKLYNFYWLLAVLSFINIGLYLIASRWYVYREHRLAGKGIEPEEE
ncbi:NRT1/ PTR family 6.3-like protein [Tanacetum coccineum]